METYTNPIPTAQSETYSGEAPQQKKTIGSYLVWLIATLLPSVFPVVGFIVLLIIALTDKNKDRGNFFKAFLLLHVIIAVLCAAVVGVVLAVYWEQILPFVSANY